MSKNIETDQDLQETLKAVEKLLVLFYASWCPFCGEFLPVFEKHAKELGSNACRVETDEAEGCEEQYEINIVPTIIYFENGRPIKRLDGKAGRGLTEKQLEEMIDSCGLKGAR
jgi:thioredoxin 1